MHDFLLAFAIKARDEPARRPCMRPQPAPHHRGDVQGGLARALDVATQRSTRASTACLDQGHALSTMHRHRRLRRRQPASVQKGLEHLGSAAVVTATRASRRAGRRAARRGRLRRAWTNLAHLRADRVRCAPAIASGTPFLGICVGMQLLFEESEEFGPVRGPRRAARRRCVRFPGAGLKVPHMGWNQLAHRGACAALAGIADGAYVYFVHSYYAEPARSGRRRRHDGLRRRGFAAASARDNVFATQFHPEKSQRVGAALLGTSPRSSRRRRVA